MKLALIMQTSDHQDRIFPIDRDRTVIGRDGRCDLRLPIPSVSSRHCEILLENQRAVLLNRDETMETLVNGAAVTRTQLADEDVVQIGPVTFRVSMSVSDPQGSTDLSVRREP
ncbi:MAG: FHA domain-containing protein [Phycisphaerales bacterium]|nr:FHA domain-containing protein [Phycisphaerales bacterium]